MKLVDIKHIDRLITRYWSHVIKGDSCWLYTGTLDNNGYGVLSIRYMCGRTRIYAHRVPFLLRDGELEPTTFVCHTCDNPACVNPDHLYLGGWKSNAQDRAVRGRSARNWKHGIESKGHKLTDAIVHEMKARHAKGESGRNLAKEFSVSATVANRAIRGADWHHVQQ